MEKEPLRYLGRMDVRLEKKGKSNMIAKILESRKQMDHRFIQMEKVKTQAGSKGNLG